MLDEYEEKEEDLKLPEIPSELLDPMEVETVDLDKEIESRLTKLKFFNKTWFEEVPKNLTIKSEKTDDEVSRTVNEAVNNDENEDPAIKLDLELNDHEADRVLDFEEVEREPVFSTKEDAEAFNDWYYEKISQSKAKPVFKASSNVAPDMLIPNRQILINRGPSMWKVDMDVVIVMMITLISCLPKFPRLKPVPNLSPTSPTVDPISSTVCETGLGAKSATAATAATHGELRIPVWEMLFGKENSGNCDKLKIK